MKFRINFKTPDAVHYGILKALPVAETPHEAMDNQDLHDDMLRATSEFVRNGEYVSIEFDTETKTARVLSV